MDPPVKVGEFQAPAMIAASDVPVENQNRQTSMAENDWTSVANGNIEVQSIDPLTELVTATIGRTPGANRLLVRLKAESKP